jgi:2-polyprenyl-6-methoxyphenol hydroxylase-like FAD-dependent oxidoreductase
MTMRIAIVGAGPAGLFLARLIKKTMPETQVEMFEQNPRNATYGFGVTLAGAARARLGEVDPEVQARLEEAMVFNSTQAIVLDDESILLKYAGAGGAIERLNLLTILERLCEEVGITPRYETRVNAKSDLKAWGLPSESGDYDLIVGADGANSAVRATMGSGFRMITRTLGNRFVWYGVGKALSPNALVFRHYQGGVFIAHYYAYTANMSTFVAECDADTWTRCGLDKMTDAERKALIEDIFSPELEGETLLENKSIWRQFTAQVAEDWSCGNAVLIGDALRVAHFSIGSGTRLAMDDALALHDALVGCEGDIPAALAAYEADRRPNRDLFTEATEKSIEWYENIADRMQTDVASFAHDFLTRTGRVDDKRLERYAPEFYRDHVAPRLEREAAVGGRRG